MAKSHPPFPPRLRVKGVRIKSWDLGVPEGDGRDGCFIPLDPGYTEFTDGLAAGISARQSHGTTPDDQRVAGEQHASDRR